MYKITIVKKTQDDLAWFRRNDKSSYIKCFDLVRELIENPRAGTGKPAPLFAGAGYSRE
jgi:toxin YoeB